MQRTGPLHDRVPSELACPVGRVGRMSLCRSRIRKSSARMFIDILQGMHDLRVTIGEASGPEDQADG
ncbi:MULTISPECIES: hypothetical protein [unclassified Streptomyces]|uniref:hypothetical protein n=1 Tax=unclassified Streptomyces TaxID=2593676 RepID=UPI003D8E9182